MNNNIKNKTKNQTQTSNISYRHRNVANLTKLSNNIKTNNGNNYNNIDVMMRKMFGMYVQLFVIIKLIFFILNKYIQQVNNNDNNLTLQLLNYI